MNSIFLPNQSFQRTVKKLRFLPPAEFARYAFHQPARRIEMTLKALATVVSAAAILLATHSAYGQSVMDECRAYARAIEAVAEARDNLDEPSWDKLIELHPIIKKNGKNDRAVLFAQMINLRMINKNATPRALKMNAFESCPMTYSCMFRNEGCPNK
ncbi:MAG: hypothetical protein ACYC2E_13075 [Sulfuricella sp.]